MKCQDPLEPEFISGQQTVRESDFFLLFLLHLAGAPFLSPTMNQHKPMFLSLQLNSSIVYDLVASLLHFSNTERKRKSEYSTTFCN